MSGASVSCLQLDVGNSGAKWRLLVDDAVQARGRYAVSDPASAAPLLGCTEALDCIWVASVASAEQDQALAAMLTERWGVAPRFVTTPARTGDLVNSYREPQRMGVDRWLAMLGARARCSERLCVVDVGSAVTIDVVAADGHHEGGYIIPGAELMERALLRDTQRVRFDRQAPPDLAPGTDTAQAVQHGIALALCGAVELAVNHAAAAGEQPRFFLTGGGADAASGLLRIEFDLVPDLVFEGLSILSESAAA